MSTRRDEDFLQAIAGVANLAGFTLKGVASADDFAIRTVTVKFIRKSDGHVQEIFDWEREANQLAVVDGINGHVESVTTLQPGDLAETEAAANAEIAAAAEELPDAPDNDEPRDPDQALVGELAAAAKQNRRR